MATAEVIVSPQLDKQSLKKMNTQYQKSFKKMGDDAEKHVEKGVAKGVAGGVKKGGKASGMFGKVRGAGRKGFDSVGGARGIATGLGGIALAGLIDAIDKASEARDTMSGLLEESTASGQLAGAKAAGFTTGQYGQFSAQLQNIGGLQDQNAIADLMQDINVKVQENITDGGVLKNFGKYTGQERINRVLAGISQESAAQQQETLNQIGITGEDGRAMMAVVQKAGKEGGFNEALAFLNESQKTEGQIIGENLETEATLAKEYRAKQIAFNNEMRAKMFDNIDSDKIDKLFSQREIEAGKQVKALENFETNQDIANKAVKSLEGTMDTLNKTTRDLFNTVTNIADDISDFINNNPVKRIKDKADELLGSSKTQKPGEGFQGYS